MERAIEKNLVDDTKSKGEEKTIEQPTILLHGDLESQDENTRNQKLAIEKGNEEHAIFAAETLKGLCKILEGIGDIQGSSRKEEYTPQELAEYITIVEENDLGSEKAKEALLKIPRTYDLRKAVRLLKEKEKANIELRKKIFTSSKRNTKSR